MPRSIKRTIQRPQVKYRKRLNSSYNFRSIVRFGDEYSMSFCLRINEKDKVPTGKYSQEELKHWSYHC